MEIKKKKSQSNLFKLFHLLIFFFPLNYKHKFVGQKYFSVSFYSLFFFDEGKKKNKINEFL